MTKDTYTFNELLEIMNLLRSESGCPWDREQTHDSLKRYLIEETYEVLDAIDSEIPAKLTEELGDLLLQIVFHSQLAKEAGTFNIDDVINSISKKMVSRHKHVFGGSKLKTAQDVIDVWDSNKQKEKGIPTVTNMMREIPSGMPALMRSFKVQQKAAKVGFDWDDIKYVYDKIHEEIEELKSASQEKDLQKTSDELGDLLFAVVNLSRFLNVHPEISLAQTTERFINRFEHIEQSATIAGKKLDDLSLKEMDILWEEAKIKAAGGGK